MIEIILPWPPSLNHYWRNVRGKMLISKGGREYRKAVDRIVRESGAKCIEGAIALKRILYCPDLRRRDEDNTVKAIYDALGAAGLWQDDSFVCAGVFEKRLDPERKGRVVLQIKALKSGARVEKSGAWLEDKTNE